MKTTLVKLHLRNFKKIKSKTIEFDSRLTTIQADNGVGKSTIFDAFNWVLFGKDSKNKSDFSVKTLDENNNAIPKLEHEVTAEIIIDGELKVFRRVYVEKYTKKRNSATEEFTGHSESFYINDVPKTATEYNAYISNLLQTNVFRMVTDPTYFNEQMKWEQRREILVQMAGNLTPEMVFISNPELTEIKNLKTIEEIQDKKKEIDAQRKKCKEEFENIPARLDELDQQLKTDLTSEKEIKAQIETLETELQDKQDALNNDFAAATQENQRLTELNLEKGRLEREIQNELNNAQIECDKAYNNELRKKTDIENQIQSLKAHIESKKYQIINLKTKIDSLKSENATLKVEYTAKAQQNFDVSSGICPSCQQALPLNMIEIKKQTFNNVKAETLQKLIDKANKNSEKALKIKAEIDVIESQIKDIELTITTLSNDLQAIVLPNKNEPITSTEKTILLQNKINVILEALQNRAKVETNETLKEEIQAVKTQIVELQNQLSQHAFNKQIKERQDELIKRQKALIEKLGSIELIENQILKFNKLYMENIETMVNVLFSHGVKFKLFEAQINGGEKPTCVCLVDGVPYSDVNTASKINAGLVIINTLQNHFNFQAPIFIDNRESISEIVPMQSQIINLEKVTGVNELTVL